MPDLEQRLAAGSGPSRNATATIAEGIATIAERDATIAKLEKRVAELETKLGQNSSNSSLPSTDRGQNPHRNAKEGHEAEETEEALAADVIRSCCRRSRWTPSTTTTRPSAARAASDYRRRRTRSRSAIK
ncbi:MAG: DUF6444 domain-containing protein [Sandaracinaceae bacterium]